MGEDEFGGDNKKAHIKRKAGKKADKKKEKHVQEGQTPKQKNPKAFAIQNVKKAERGVRRKEDIQEKRKHVPSVDRSPVEPPPIVVAIVGPPKVGKSTLLQCLIKNFTRQTLSNIQGPVTVVSGKKRRLTFVECNNDINSMIDIAKVADLVLLLIDASFGFEMEVFEFLNICQVHGFPKIMGVLTHLDTFKNTKTLQRTKKNLKHRFWTEVYQGAKLFYLSGMIHGEYQKTEVHNLGRFISVMKFRPLLWRTTHPFLIGDRIEDVTNPEEIRVNPKCDRSVSMYGYVRGTHLKKNCDLHLAGVGDFKMADITFLPDPCPLPEEIKKRRTLVEKEKSIYAPMSGVGGIVYDKDAVYIDLGGSHSHQVSQKQDEEEEEGTNDLVSGIIQTETTLDEKMEKSELRLFSQSQPITSAQHREGVKYELVNDNGRVRRKALFDDEDGESDDEDEGDDDSESGEEEEGDESDEDKDGSDESESDEEENEIEKKVKLKRKTEDPIETLQIKKKKIEKPKEEMTLKERNKLLKEEMGDDGSESDFSESENEEEDKEETLSVKLMESSDEDEDQNEKIESKKTKSSDKFHHRLTTEKDADIHSKITQVLSKIQSNEQVEGQKKKDMDSGKGTDTDESSDSDSSSEDEEPENENTKDDDDEESEEDQVEESSLRWKSDLAKKASESFYSRQSSTSCLRKLVYGQENSAGDEDEGGDESEDEMGGLFKVVRRDEEAKTEAAQHADGLDCSLFTVAKLQDWNDLDICDMIKDCFVTGKWAAGRDAEELLKMDDEDDDEMYGDFEDLETGEKEETKEKEEEEGPRVVDLEGAVEREKAKRKTRMERKLKLKKEFDMDYDDGEGGNGNNYHDELKKECDDQAALNRGEFEGMEDSVRVQYEGYRPGMYVRVELTGVPCELINNFDPTAPLVLGGLVQGEDQIGYVQVRIKKHRWYPKILKNKDPLIVSLGWRRFQTLPVYSVSDHNMRHRMLKYTPQHLHCDAYFWGPLTPQGTGMMAVQSLADKQTNFRIVATGVVVEMDKSTQIVKKLKLTGEPYKVFKKTAFIKGMFTSTLEVSKFEKAAIRTVSGIRGMIKKSLSQPEGAFRATFEDKILLSDIVFIKTWFTVDVPKYFAPVTNLLMAKEERATWKGMRTVGQIKRDHNVQAVVNPDNLYTSIERKPKVFSDLQIPRNLQEDLPYNLKPKMAGKANDPEKDRVAVVLDHKERKVANAFKMMRAVFEDKQDKMNKEQTKRMETLIKRKNAEGERTMRKQKEARQQISRMMSKEKDKQERLRNKKEKMEAKKNR